jgi:hypothetical protein
MIHTEYPTVECLTDWGTNFNARWRRSFRYSLIFVFIVIAIAEAGSSFSIPASEIVFAFLVGVFVSSLVALRIATTAIGLVRFEPDRIVFVRVQFPKVRWVRDISMQYDECKVIETSDWKIRRFYELQFYGGKKHCLSLGDSECKQSYGSIKEQCRRRLPLERVRFLSE